MRVATERTYGETATVGVWVDTGSRYETPQNNGVAHYMEHLSFKGTRRRTRIGLEVEVENIGGHLNAYTSREMTVYYAKVFKDKVPQAMDILSDILLHSNYTAGAVEAERSTILREMKSIDEQMEEVIFDRLHETAYRGHPLGMTILGPAENIRSITRQDIIDYVQTHYTAPRMVICATGNVDHNQLCQLTQQYFGQVPSLPRGGRPYPNPPARFTGSEIRHNQSSGIEHAHIALSFEMPGWKDPDSFPFMVIQTMMGAWDQLSAGGAHSLSPMVATVASNDLAKSIMPFNTQYTDTGLFGVYAVAHPEGGKAGRTTEAIVDEFMSMCRDVDEERLEEAKNQLIMTLLSSLDGTTVLAEEIGRHMLVYGRRLPPAEMVARVAAVQKEDVLACARRFFLDKPFALAALGPIKDIPSYAQLQDRMKRKAVF